MNVDADQVRRMESISYAIGFEKSYGHPEIIIFGLPAEPAHRIPRVTAAAIKEGEEMPLHEPVGNIIDGDFKVKFKPLDHTSYADYLSVAITAYGTEDFRTTVVKANIFTVICFSTSHFRLIVVGRINHRLLLDYIL